MQVRDMLEELPGLRRNEESSMSISAPIVRWLLSCGHDGEPCHVQKRTTRCPSHGLTLPGEEIQQNKDASVP
jgi:hypothetical protein